MKLPRRQFLHLAVGGAAIRRSAGVWFADSSTPQLEQPTSLTAAAITWRTRPSTSTASWSTETRRLQWHKR